ncbi:MAG: hypothetical protein WCU88_11790 [Elusimicrobiota bacterium]
MNSLADRFFGKFLLACLLAAAVPSVHAQESRGAAFVGSVENLLWDDHVDVREPRFMLARAGISLAELSEELARVLSDTTETESVRERSARLLGRIAFRSPIVEKALKTASADPSARVREAAKKALGRLKA